MFWSKDRLITHVVPAKPFPETFKLGSGTFFSEPGDAKDPARYQKKKAELQVSLQEAERISMHENTNIQKQLRTIKWLKIQVLEPDCLGSKPQSSTNCETLEKLCISL